MAIVLTDKDEAFKHNSCKKLAQLSKVIVAMQNSALERISSSRQLSHWYEERICKVISDSRSELMKINDDLCQFRKDGIDEKCKEYGQYYKDIKRSYNVLVTERVNKVNDLSREGKNFDDEIKQVNTDSLQNVENALKAMERFETLVKSSRSKGNAKAHQDLIKKMVQPIIDDTKNFMAKSSSEYSSLLDSYRKEVSNLKVEIASIMKNEVTKAKPDLQILKGRLNVMNESYKSLLSDYKSCDKSHSEFSNSITKRRMSMVADVKTTVRRYQSQISVENEKNAAEVRKLTKSISNAESSFKKRKAQMKTELDTIDKEISSVLNNAKKMREKAEPDIEMQKAELEKKQHSTLLTFEKEISRKKSIISNSTTMTDSYVNDMIKIRNSFEEMLQADLSELRSKQEEFNIKLSTHLTDEKSRLDDFMNYFQEIYLQKQRYLEESFDNFKKDSAEIKEKMEKDNMSLKDSIDKLKQEISVEITSTKEDHFNKVSEYEKSCITNKESKRSEKDEFIQRRMNQCSNGSDTLKSNCKIELDKKVRKISEDNSSNISELIKELNEDKTIETAIENHKMEVKHASLKSEGAIKVVEDAKADAISKLEALQIQVSNGEKSVRQFRRSTKTENEAINKEYEMKIQFEQVSLSDKIERLSSLYSQEENQRGTEIIEAIRKIRNVENRYEELIENEIKSIKKYKEQLSNEIEMLKTKISHYKDEKEIKELENKINDKRKDLIVQLHTLKEKHIAKVEAMNKSIEDKIALNSAIKTEIREKMEKNSSESKQLYNDLVEKKKLIESDKKERKLEIERSFEEKKNKLEEEHAKEVERLNNRIVSAKNIAKELETKFETVIREKSKEFDDNIKVSYDNNEPSISSSREKHGDSSIKLDEITQNLTEQQHRFESELLNPLMRDVEESIVEEKKRTLNEGTVFIKECVNELEMFLYKSQDRVFSVQCLLNTTPRAKRQYNSKNSASISEKLKSSTRAAPSIVSPYI